MCCKHVLLMLSDVLEGMGAGMQLSHVASSGQLASIIIIPLTSCEVVPTQDQLYDTSHACSSAAPCRLQCGCQAAARAPRCFSSIMAASTRCSSADRSPHLHACQHARFVFTTRRHTGQNSPLHCMPCMYGSFQHKAVILLPALLRDGPPCISGESTHHACGSYVLLPLLVRTSARGAALPQAP